MDGRTDGRTERRRVRQQSVVFSKKIYQTNACDEYDYFFAMQECTLKIVLV